MAINVDLVADASTAIKEAGKFGDALEDVADELKAVGTAGKSIDDKVGDAFESIQKEAKTTGKTVEDAGDAFRSLAKDAKKAGDSIGDDVRKGTDKAGEGFDEMKSEAAGTAREAGASFSSIEDSADVLQEVLANAFAGFGPAGMAAGILAAAGIGLLFAQAQGAAEKIQENKEKMLDLAQTIRDNGGVLTEADYIAQMEEYGYAIQDTKEWWELFQEDAVTGFEQLRDLADQTGLSTREIFRGGFGDAKEAQATLDKVNARIQELKDKKEAVYNLTGSIITVPEAEELASLEKSRDLIQENVDKQKDAALVDSIRKGGVDSLTDSVTDNRVALKDQADQASEAAERERDLAAYVAGTVEHFRAQADAVEEATDALKGAVTTELDYLDKQDALKVKLAESGNAWDINTAKGRDNQRAVVDIASGIEEMARASLDAGAPVADVTAKFQAQKDTLVNQVLPAFNGNREAAQLYIDTILKTPAIQKTTVQLNKEQALRDLEALQSPRGIPMHISGVDGTKVENYFMSQQGRKIFVEFAPRGGGQAAMLP